MVVVVAGAVVVAGVVQVGGVAGDQDPGDRTVTGQPPTRLGVQREAVADLAAQAAGVAEEAVQVHGDQQLGPDPTRLGQLAALPGCGGPARPGHQPGADHRCGYRGRRPGGPAVPGRPARSGRPRPPAARRGRPSPPRWRPATAPGDHGAARPGPRHPRGRQPPGDGPRTRRSRGGSSRRAASTSTGSASAARWSGSSLGAVGQHLGMGWGDLPVGQGLGGRGQGTTEQGPGGPHRTWRPPPPPSAAGPQPAGGRAGLGPLLGPSRPAGVHRGQLTQPQAFQAVPQPPQPTHPLGPGAIGQPVEGPGRPAPGARPPAPPAPPTGWSNVCSSPWRQPTNPPPEHKHPHKFVENLLAGTTRQPSRGLRAGASRIRHRRVMACRSATAGTAVSYPVPHAASSQSCRAGACAPPTAAKQLDRAPILDRCMPQPPTRGKAAVAVSATTIWAADSDGACLAARAARAASSPTSRPSRSDSSQRTSSRSQ